MENIFLLNKAVGRQLTSPTPPAKDCCRLNGKFRMSMEKFHTCQTALERDYIDHWKCLLILVRRVSTVSLFFKQGHHNRIDLDISLNKGKLFFYKKSGHKLSLNSRFCAAFMGRGGSMVLLSRSSARKWHMFFGTVYNREQ